MTYGPARAALEVFSLMDDAMRNESLLDFINMTEAQNEEMLSWTISESFRNEPQHLYALMLALEIQMRHMRRDMGEEPLLEAACDDLFRRLREKASERVTIAFDIAAERLADQDRVRSRT